MNKPKNIFFVIGLLLLIISYLLMAQEERSEAFSLSRAHIIVSQEAGQLIDAGLSAQQQGNWVAALKNYQQTMEQYPNYTVPVQGRLIYQGVKHFCCELIRQMPQTGYQMYQTLYDPVAKSFFESGVSQRRIDLLNRLVEQYPFSSYSLSALILLGYDALERNEYHQARAFFNEALRLPYLSADEQHKLKALSSFSAEHFSSPDTHQRMMSLDMIEWRTYGGNNAHQQVMVPSLQTLPPKAWYFKIPVSANQFPRLVPEWGGVPPAPIEPRHYRPYIPCFSGSFHSIHAGGIIYLATDNAVYAFNLIQPTGTNESRPLTSTAQTGKPLWKFELPLPAGALPFEERQIHPCTLLSIDTDRVSTQPKQNILYANLITSLAEREQRLGFLEVKPALPNRALFAFDAETGKILWNTGGDNTAREFLKRTSFPMSPAGLGNNLYAVAIYIEHPTDLPEHYLVCLEPQTGNLRWRTFIASGLLETNLFNNPTRESIGTTLTLNEDSIFYCSNMGIVAALDQRTGLIKWIRKYHQYDITPTMDVTPIRLPWHWINNPIIYVNSPLLPAPLLLVTPVDSPYLYALDPVTGDEVWKWNGRELGRVRYLIGVHDALLFVSGEQGLICFDLNKQGKRKWVYQRVGPEILLGKPGLTEEILYLPTSSEIKLLDTASGKLVNTWPLVNPESELGNIFLWNNILVTTSLDQLNVFYDPSNLETWLFQELKKQPNDPYLLNKLGEARLRAGKYEEALKYFKQAYRMIQSEPHKSSLADTIKNTLYKTYLNLGSGVVPGTILPQEKLRYLEQAREWSPGPKAFINATIHLIEYYQKQTSTDTTKMVELYQYLLENYPEANSPQSGIRVWDWVKNKIDELIQQHGRVAYASQEIKARQFWQQMVPETTPLPLLQTKDAVLKLFQCYPNSELSEKKMFEICLELEKNQHYTEAQMLSNLFITHFANSKNSAPVYTILIQNYERQGKYLLARNLLRYLNQTMPDQELVLPSGTRMRIREYVTKKLSTPEYQNLTSKTHREPSLTPPLTSGWSYINRNTTHVQPLIPEFISSKEWVNLVLVLNEEEVQLVNTTDGLVLWKTQIKTEFKPHFIVVEQTLVILAKTEICALRLKSTKSGQSDGAVVWRYPPNTMNQTGALFAQWTFDFTGKRIFSLARHPINPDQFKIIMLDTLTGKEIWSYAGSGQIVGNIFTSETHLILPTSQNGILLLAQDTGKVTRVIKPEQPIASVLYLPASTTGESIQTNEQLCILSQGTTAQIEVYDLTTGRVINGFTAESTEPAGAAEVAPDSFKTNGREVVWFTMPKRSDPIPSYQAVLFQPTNGKKTYSAQLNDYIKYITANREYLYIIARLRNERDKLKVTAYKITTREQLVAHWSCPVELTETTSFSQVLLTEKQIVLNCSSYNRDEKNWTPLIYLIDKNTGTITQKIIGDLKSQGQPEILVTDGILMTVQDNRLTAYLGK